ncbi:MAG TPA: MarC family protein [Ignavibacteria bacterium]|nr:MarC family protein [Ignavibacteria bacterium]
MLEFIQTFIFLFAVIDPLGSIPVFLEATNKFDDKTKKSIALKAVFFAALILIFFIAVGQIIMDNMEISLSAFQISGGIILFLFSLTMIFGDGKPENEKKMINDQQNVTIFPIAIPAIASPAAIMGVVILTDNNVYSITDQIFTTLNVLMVLFVTYIFLLAARKIQNRIGASGILVISKIMGMILASFAIQSILSGIKEYFKIQ